MNHQQVENHLSDLNLDMKKLDYQERIRFVFDWFGGDDILISIYFPLFLGQLIPKVKFISGYFFEVLITFFWCLIFGTCMPSLIVVKLNILFDSLI